MEHEQDWGKDFSPSAIYFEDSDSLEYVSEDCPCVYRRIDDILTLLLSVDERRPIGVQLKGFRNFYLRKLQNKYGLNDNHFLKLTTALEEAMNAIGDSTFRSDRLESYTMALDLADRNSVEVRDFPRLAG